MPEQTMIQLGDHTGIPVVPQRHARLRNLLRSGDLEKLATENYGPETYRLLCVLVPAIETAIPLWEWEGYGSQEAMDSDTYDDALDKSPTTAQIVDAFEAVVKVNGGDRLGKLLGLVTTVQGLNSTETQMPSSPLSSGNTGE